MTDQDKPDQNVDDDTDATRTDLEKEDNGTTDAATSEAEHNTDATEDTADAPEENGDSEADLWASAMAEQEGGDEEAGGSEEEDLWAAAMAEQQVQEDAPDEAATPAQRPAATSDTEAAGERLFRPFEQSSEGGETRDLGMILDIPVRLSVELGRTKVTIKQLLEMAQGSVVELDGLAGEPMDILINGYLIAQGEVVVVEDKYGIRITEIVTPSERIKKLNR